MKPIVQVGKAYLVELESTSMQMWLNVYELPEREPRKIVMTRKELEAAIASARQNIKELEKTVEQVKFYVDNEFTRDDVDKASMGEKYERQTFGVPGTPYDGDEDFMFMYGSLSDLYSFIYEAREALFEED